MTKSLNSKVSNGPWASKREALQAHDTLLLNSRLLSAVGDTWDEDGIDARTDAMIDVLLETWPVPAGHERRRLRGVLLAEALVDLEQHRLLALAQVLVVQDGAGDVAVALAA